MAVSSILRRAARLVRKPPGYLVRRLAREAAMEADRVLAPVSARRMAGERLARMAGSADIGELWEKLASRPYPTVTRDFDAHAFSSRFPEARQLITAAAERAIAHRVDLLGTGPVDLGVPIDWLQDFKTGDRWAPAFCRAIDYMNKGRPSDVKVPWEISRLQWLLPAGQAFLLTGEERYAEAARDVLEQWIEANPYAWTVNWSCTMEPALRILAWTWLFHVFARSSAWNDESFRGRFLSALYLHGQFTERHIERSTINGNHLTADASGLVFAGLFFQGIGNADRWAAEGWRTLEQEILVQVHPDGVDFEASVPYHRLVAELFLLPARYKLAAGQAISASYRERLIAMARFADAYCRPDGTSPHWGDADDGRALPFGTQPLDDHRYLVGLIGLTFGDEQLMAKAWGEGDEIAWHCGMQVLDRPPVWHEPDSVAFPDGGVYILRDARNHVFIDCGPVGLAGLGGHGHNDPLSFEAWLEGAPLIVDPGSFVYTASFEDRNAFRSTDVHNTPRVDGKEVNRLYAPDNLWNLHDDAKAEALSFEVTELGGSFRGRHSGYGRLAEPVSVQREIALSVRPASLTVIDTIEGKGTHAVSVPLHFAPGISLREQSVGRWVAERDDCSFLIEWSGGGWAVVEEDTRISPSYGVVLPAKRLVWRIEAELSLRLSVTIAAMPKSDT
ncbi:alginate lyase family protein [Mesorhizobium sp. ZC-5]|uniref:alginate lyase family protein n=1 Tax=Mesorhizobium sp. ZC-5 TaxID=2986066 RepID=UPI0021E6DC3C|nr:alginate lyase family protein [Mesorhizobium sp. ZC-5]MCV3243677.1 heparinase II/III family protein [Mesorhizobium sp. ZC-5]